MRRLCLAVPLALACSRPAAPPSAGLPAAFALLPADASLLAHVDLQALRAAPLWESNRAVLDADPDARRTLDALAACRLPFEALQALDLAVSADGRDVAAVVTGEGVGDPERLTCLQGQLPDRGLRVEPGPEPTLAVGDARGFFHGPTVLVLATPGYQQAVAALRAGPGPGGPLHALAAGVTPGRAIWFVGQIPDKSARTLAPALSGLRQVRGALDLSEGLGLELDLAMESEARAAAVAAELRGQLEGLRGAGLPAPVVQRVELRQTGAELRVAARLTIAEIAAIQALAAAVPAAQAPAPPPAR